MWVSLIEKAFAKLHTRYDALNVGKMATGMRALTGAPCFDFNHKETPDLFNLIQEAIKHEYEVTTLTANVENEGTVLRSGLVQGHVYSVLNALNVNSQG